VRGAFMTDVIMADDDQKLSLQAFLQVLTSKSLPISRAMTVASKMCCICPLGLQNILKK
jgi:hypothetical protein